MQKTAIDVLPLGYDIQSGHGRVNAEEALEKVTLPYRVRHFQQTINTSSATLHSSNQVVAYPEGFPGLEGDLTYGLTDIYQLNVTLNHTIPASESYVDGWVRNSVSDLFSLTNIINNPHWSGVEMNSSDIDEASLTGYIYKTRIYDFSGNYLGVRWYPTDLNSDATIGYTIHTLEDINTGISGVVNDLKINLFPNPATNELNLTFDSPDGNIVIKIIDISGRLLNKYQFKKAEEKMQTEKIDISHLSSGMYFCSFSFGDETISLKFLKE